MTVTVTRSDWFKQGKQSTTPTGMSVLCDLIGGDIRLIKLKTQSKIPVDSWKEINYPPGDQALIEWVSNGNNYGYFFKPDSNLCGLDADDPGSIQDLIQAIGDTLTIRSGKGYHIIFRCDDFPDGKNKISLKESLGDLRRGDGFYLVGPGSIHPSGKTYEIVNAAQPKKVSYNDIKHLAEKYTQSKQKVEPDPAPVPAQPKREFKPVKYPAITDRAGLRIEDIGYPAGKVTKNGDEIRGSHPVHGSTNGINYSINPVKGTWRCWRHDTGGDAVLFLAIKHGIISCEQAGSGALDTAEMMKEIEQIIKTEPEYSHNARLLEEAQKREREEWEKKNKARQDEIISQLPVREPKKLKNDIKNLKLENKLPKEHFITKYVDHWISRNDAYQEYHYCAALALLSIIADRKPHIDILNMLNPVYPNIWILELGQTSYSRKSTAMQPVKRLAGAEPRYRPMFHSFTPESLIEHLSDEPTEGDSWPPSHGYHLQDEAGQILAGINQKTYMSDMRDLLCSLYDCEDISRKLRTGKKNVKSEFNVKNPYITLLWSTTPENFINSSSGLDVTSGLLLRYFIVNPGYQKQHMPICLGSGSQSKDYTNIGTLFNQLARRMDDFDSIQMIPSDEAMKKFNKWNEDLQDKYHENPDEYRIHQSILDRMVIRVFKLAMLFTIGADELPGVDAHIRETWRLKKHRVAGDQSRLSPTIPIPDTFFYEALRLVDEYFIPQAVHALKSVEDAGEQDLQSKILNALKGAPDCCMPHSALLRKSRQTAKNFREMIDALEESGSIERFNRPGKGEKLETYYQLQEASI